MRESSDDPETRRGHIALFRHAIIGELDIEALPRGERSARIAELAARAYRRPDGRERRISVRTLWPDSQRRPAMVVVTSGGDTVPQKAGWERIGPHFVGASQEGRANMRAAA